MLNRKNVTLYVPVDRDGLEVIFRKFSLKNVSLCSASKGEVCLYVFYDRAKFFFSGKHIPPFKIREGSFILLGEVSPSSEAFAFAPPASSMRVTSAEHYVAGNLNVHHTRLRLK